MLDQSFSAENFETIFTILNRQGKVEIDSMSEEYQTVVADIHTVNEELKTLKRKKKSLWTEEEASLHAELQETLSSLKVKKADALSADMESLAEEVNGSSFLFNISKSIFDGKEEFMLSDSRAASYAMRQLLHNIQRTFKVEMSGRHQILSSIKCLLNMKMPVYIIRTDVSGFFESIPQDRLLERVLGNSLLSYKSKAFVKGILNAYEHIKDTTLVPQGYGVPRGIGISSILSEIYMQDLDSMMKSRREVIFYKRYVDDIFMITTSLGEHTSIDDYYSAMESTFLNYGLTLKPNSDSKCELVKCFPKESFSPVSFDYLGYKLNLRVENKKLSTCFSLSDKKRLKIVERIDKAFAHFENLSKVDIKAARRDLIDSLNFITGNFRLSNAKHCAKVGLYYNNDLLDDLSEFDNYTSSLHGHVLNPYVGSFRMVSERQAYIDALKDKINKIDFKARWETKTMYDFPIARIAEISSWL